MGDVPIPLRQLRSQVDTRGMPGTRLRVSALATAVGLVLAVPVLLGVVRGAGAMPRTAYELAGTPAADRLAHPLVPVRSTLHTEGNGARKHKRPAPALLVNVPARMTVRTRPDAAAPAIGAMPSSSKYYHVPIVAWVDRVSSNGRWGEVQIPYVWPRRNGWISLAGLHRATTGVSVSVDLSRHQVIVTRFGKRLFATPAATGASWSPTPPGRYFVTDRVPFPAGGSYGTFAFGISGIQPHLPVGWTGGNQLAIHGTNDPSSIGRSVSAGCVRVGQAALSRLVSLLRLGTPVVIHP